MGEVIFVLLEICLLATKVQLSRGIHSGNRIHRRSCALGQVPQRRGRYIRSFITTPRKPNSAQRKVGKVRLTNGRIIGGKIMGRGYVPHKFAVVLVRGGGHRDTPGIRYSLIRGALECLPVMTKTRRRSIYGVSLKM
jgi:small subunit ribosomal protein S12